MLLYLDLIISHSEKLVKFCRIRLALARGILYIRYKGWMTMKKLLSLLLTLSMLFSLVGCELFSPKEKEIADDDAKLAFFDSEIDVIIGADSGLAHFVFFYNVLKFNVAHCSSCFFILCFRTVSTAITVNSGIDIGKTIVILRFMMKCQRDW